MNSAIRGIRSLFRRVAPGWRPLRLALFRKLVMGYVTLRRPEVLAVDHGFKLRIPKRDRSPYVLSLYLDGEYEPEESRFITDFLAPGQLAFDIGANIGYMTCLMAKAVTGRGRVHAFEPDPTNFDVLRQNVAMNGFEGVITRCAALSSHTGTELISLSDENRGDHTLVSLPGRARIPVETVSFDEYYASSCAGQRVRLVKIDVQGYEFEVLKGMEGSLRKGVLDAVIVEFWPARVRLTGSESAEVPAFIARMPYEANIVSHIGSGVSSTAYSNLEEIAAACQKLEGEPDTSFNFLLRRCNS